MQITVAVKIRKGCEDLPLPAYHSDAASGMDLLAAVDGPVTLGPGEIRLIPTGLHISVPRGFEAQVRPRSGLALRHGITIVNTPGTIDSDYRGEVGVILANLGREPLEITRGMRIAQLVFLPVVRAQWQLVDELDDTARGEGGFGHTGR
jgi:dUTP pyrophosphatase